MGVINVTPDSFSDGGKYLDPSNALQCAISNLKFGADVLDLGAQSTRPGSDEIGAEEEIRRLLPAISVIKNKFPITFGVLTTNTYKQALKRSQEKGRGLADTTVKSINAYKAIKLN